jgi:hypothetical protein
MAHVTLTGLHPHYSSGQGICFLSWNLCFSRESLKENNKVTVHQLMEACCLVHREMEEGKLLSSTVLILTPTEPVLDRQGGEVSMEKSDGRSGRQA